MPTLFWTTNAIILSVALAGCGSKSVGREPLSRDIGPAPSYLQPVPIPPARPGQSPVIDARQLTGSLRQANKIIVCAREDWTITRDRMMGVDSGANAGACAK